MKKNTILKAALLSAALFQTACVTTEVIQPISKTKTETQTEEGDSNGIGILGQLPGQVLRAGECGLFLFAANPKPRFVFFAEATTGVGKIVLDGKEEMLVRSATGGDIVDLHYTEQTFRFVDKNVELAVTLNTAIPTTGGHQIEQAALRMTSPVGWKVVIPVGGATSCKNS